MVASLQTQRIKQGISHMKKLVSAVRKVAIMSSIFGLFLIGCVSGPVTTQIDKNKNPIVDKPPQFQSPTQAIDSLMNSSDHKFSKDHEVRQIKNSIFQTLLDQQIAIANELKKSGQLLLRPGFSYEFDLESFCVNAGVERPTKGDGLFLGDLQGRVKSWLPVILRDYKSKGISQADAQVLIWSLLSKMRFDQLNSNNQIQLIKLFPDAPVRFGNSVVEDHAKNFLLSQVPAEILSAKEQLDQYQEILQDTRLKFSEIEKIMSPVSSRTDFIDVGWLKHEDGYFIHLEASGYQQVRVKIYAPEGMKVNTYFQPAKHVAIPGIGQRLALSTSVIDRYKDKSHQLIKNKVGVSAKEALFILKHPLDAIKVHQAAQFAIETTWAHVKSSHNYQDDSTDAFRHFIWAGKLTDQIGFEKAKEYLNAHEDFPENKPAVKSMDLFNNDKGIEYSKQYKGKNFEHDLIQAGLEKVRRGELRWVK